MHNPLRICFFGDSFTNGTGDDDCLGWVGRICAAARQTGCDLTAYNLGVRRDTSGDIATRWQREAAVRLPDQYDGRLVFAFGTNDCVTSEDGNGPRVPMNEAIANAHDILTAARAWKPALMLGPMPVSDGDADRRIESLSQKLEPLCARLNVPFLNLFPIAAAIGDIWRRETESGDGIHPNRQSYAHIAQAIGEWPAWRAWIDPR